MVWAQFALCAALMIISAYALCREGMALSAVTHIEEGVIGIFFLAVATSFPEIVVGVSSVYYLGSVALGYGDLIGSVMINSMLLIVVDYMAGRGRVLAGASKMNFIAVLLWGIAAMVIVSAALLRKHYGLFSIGPLGVESFIILGLYFVYLARLKRTSSMAILVKKNMKSSLGLSLPEHGNAAMWIRFTFLLFTVMILGVWMASLGEKISASTGLSHTFVGGTLLAVVTSFPEIAVTFAAIRSGSIQMALGNIFGSNLFDLSILPFLDVLTKEPITVFLTTGQIAATAVAVLIPVILIFGMRVRDNAPKKVGFGTAMVFTAALSALTILYFVE
jgi:cation:H+ antiporter